MRIAARNFGARPRHSCAETSDERDILRIANLKCGKFKVPKI
jgi:hypothetical protein